MNFKLLLMGDHTTKQAYLQALLQTEPMGFRLNSGVELYKLLCLDQAQQVCHLTIWNLADDSANECFMLGADLVLILLDLSEPTNFHRVNYYQQKVNSLLEQVPMVVAMDKTDKYQPIIKQLTKNQAIIKISTKKAQQLIKPLNQLFSQKIGSPVQIKAVIPDL